MYTHWTVQVAMSLFLKCSSSKLHLMVWLESDQMRQSSCQSQPSKMHLLPIRLHPYLLSWVLRDFSSTDFELEKIAPGWWLDWCNLELQSQRLANHPIWVAVKSAFTHLPALEATTIVVVDGTDWQLCKDLRIVGDGCKGDLFNTFAIPHCWAFFQISTMGAKARQRIGGTTSTRASLPLALKLPNPPPSKLSQTKLDTGWSPSGFGRICPLVQGAVSPTGRDTTWQAVGMLAWKTKTWIWSFVSLWLKTSRIRVVPKEPPKCRW